MKKFLMLLLVLVGCGYSHKQEIEYKEDIVVSVHDGDTFTGYTGAKYRLAGLDCPELGQSYGFEAQSVTSGFLLNKKIKYLVQAKDKYGRYVVDVWVNDIWLNQLLVQTGCAWVYKSFGTASFYQLMLTARHQRVGLWKEFDPEPPFLYRNRKRNTISLRPENSYTSKLVGVFGE